MKNSFTRCLGSLLLLAGLTAATPEESAAQSNRHLILFRDKTGTPYTVAQPLQFLSQRSLARRQRQNIAVTARDLPPPPAYLNMVAAAGATVLYRTRWFNGAIIECDSSNLAAIRALPFVVSARTLNRRSGGNRPARPQKLQTDPERPSSANPYGQAYWQAKMIDATTMHAAGFRGEGIHIAVFDAGFPGVNTIPALQPLFQQNRILSTFDFVNKDDGVYESYPHGTWVLSTIGANQPNTFIGTAPNASFHLMLTEDISSEHPIEEANWLVAAEYADSAGVDIITSSLGYHDFDFPSPSYAYSDMDGNTGISSRAADLASGVGILVVNSAGNDGGNSWRYIAAPADADSVLAVGAVDSMGIKAGFSSVGPTADGRIKPNLSSQGVFSAIIDPNGSVTRGNGTSFACPILTGMAAGFWQANPTLSAQQVRRFLEQSGSQASNPDNNLGYGIPNFRRAYNLANPNAPLSVAADDVDGRAVPELFPNPVPGAAFGLRLPKRLVNQTLRISLTDATGRVLSEQDAKAADGTEAVLINLEKPLSAGLYFCVVKAATGEQHTLRFLKN